MRKSSKWGSSVLLVVAFASGCGPSNEQSQHSDSSQTLEGAWRAKVQFQDGAFSPVKDLEFLYVFNAGGTMMESSNYDAAPPVPPAYGMWKKIGRNQFEARYEFFSTRIPDTSEHIAAGINWLPAGHGILVETISVADDGKSFASKIRYDAFDQTGKPVDGGGNATGQAVSLKF